MFLAHDINSCDFSKPLSNPKLDTTFFPKLRVAPPKIMPVILIPESVMDFIFDSTKPQNEGLVPWKDDVSHCTGKITGHFALGKSLGSKMILQAEKLF